MNCPFGEELDGNPMIGTWAKDLVIFSEILHGQRVAPSLTRVKRVRS